MSSYLVQLHVVAFKELAHIGQCHKHDCVLLQRFPEGSEQVLHLMREQNIPPKTHFVPGETDPPIIDLISLK